MPINDVRNTVLAIANKNNYGYISPQDFNLYAQQAQMDMFEDYFYQYNNWINRENNRTSGSGYADIIKGLEEVIDSFSVEGFLSLSTGVPAGSNNYVLPSNYYLISKLFRYPTLRVAGTTPGVVANSLVAPGNANDTIVLSTDLFSNPAGLPSESYAIYDAKNIVEVERVSQRKIFNLTSSQLTAPTKQYPCYVLEGDMITVYPTIWDGYNIPYTVGDIMGLCDVKAQYIRYPNTPRWTWVELTGGEPIFDASPADYQDFELPISDEPALVAKICQYVGISIREKEVVEFGITEETKDTQETS